MLSQSAEYVLRVVVYLALQDGKPCTTRQIAQATRTPEGYLSKLLQSLGRAGLVKSQRGLHGGSVLAAAPDQISLYDVISAIEPPQRVHGCPVGIESHSGGRLCALHRRLDEAMAIVEKAFRESTVADMLADHVGSGPLGYRGEAKNAEPAKRSISRRRS